MNIEEYQEKSKRTLNQKLIVEDNITNMIFGIVGETGEVVDLLKKHRYQGHELDMTKLKEELGDVMFYIANLCNLYEIKLNEVLEGNYNKLRRRYPQGFDTDKSINRSTGK